MSADLVVYRFPHRGRGQVRAMLTSWRGELRAPEISIHSDGVLVSEQVAHTGV